MKSVIVALIFLIHQQGSAHSVVDLTEYTADEFNSELQNHESIFVKFFTPSCPHCKAMASDFALVARQLHDQDQPIVLAEVDCSHEAGEPICTANKVYAFPSLRLYRYGHLYKEYKGDRTAKAMKRWTLNQIQGSSKLVTSATELRNIVQQSDVITVSAVVKSGQLKQLTHFLKTSKRVKQHPVFADIQFYHLITQEISQTVWASVTNQKTGATVTLRRPDWLKSRLEKQEIVLPLTTKHNLTAWIFNQSYGIVKYRTPKTDRNIHDPQTIGRLVVAYYDFDIRLEYDKTHSVRDQLVPYANQYPHITIAISRTSDYVYYLKSKSLPLPQASDPPVVMMYDKLTIPYLMDGDLSENMRTFLETGYGNQLKPHLRSKESCPSSSNWTLTCITSQDLKSRFTKSAILVVYRQMNDETQKLVTKLQKLTEKSVTESLDFLSLDASVNELPQVFDSPDFPSLFFVNVTLKVTRIERNRIDSVMPDLIRKFIPKKISKIQRKTEL